MNKVTVTNENFAEVMELVMTGRASFYVPTCTTCTKITAKNLKSWAASGLTLLSLDKDGKGFRMASGRKSVYVLPGQLIAAAV